MRCILQVATLGCLLALTLFTAAHTWIEEMRLIASNGSYVGATGFPRGFISRDNKDKKDPNSIVYMLPSNSPAADLMCGKLQTVGTQTDGFPRLKAAAKDHVALRYEENGHVTQPGTPEGKPDGRGTVFVYGTKSSSNSDKFLAIHRVWNAAGTGGDKRGKLLASQPFDDKSCFQNGGGQVAKDRSGPLGITPNTEVKCQNNIQLPDDVGSSGMYTLYWVWEWPTLFTNGNIQSNQSYTSCMDIDLVASPVADAGPFTAKQSGANVNSVALAKQMSTPFMVDPNAPLKVASDTLGSVQPGGVQPAKVPAAGGVDPTSVAKSSLGVATTTHSTTTTHQSTSAPQGLVTVTVAVPTTIEKTVTVFMPAVSSSHLASSSSAFKSTSAPAPAIAKSIPISAPAVSSLLVVAPSSSHSLEKTVTTVQVITKTSTGVAAPPTSISSEASSSSHLFTSTTTTAAAVKPSSLVSSAGAGSSSSQALKSTDTTLSTVTKAKSTSIAPFFSTVAVSSFPFTSIKATGSAVVPSPASSSSSHATSSSSLASSSASSVSLSSTHSVFASSASSSISPVTSSSSSYASSSTASSSSFSTHAVPPSSSSSTAGVTSSSAASKVTINIPSPISTVSGKYPTDTAVPVVIPLLAGNSTNGKAIIPGRFRRH